ncbi:MAG: hypothetical protein Q8M92_10620 [Candidatus Subteraquimicrobiales bacterium]|nr:hypothetical protein [Candidatus Subteraquimicrobiales bacterium]
MIMSNSAASPIKKMFFKETKLTIYDDDRRIQKESPSAHKENSGGRIYSGRYHSGGRGFFFDS